MNTKVYVVISAYEFNSSPLSDLVAHGIYSTYKKAHEEMSRLDKIQSKKIEKKLVWIIESIDHTD